MLPIIQAAGWPIWPLIICSIVALALVIERFAALRAFKVNPPNLLEEAIAVSRNGLPPSEVVEHLKNSSVLGSVLGAGLAVRKQGQHGAAVTEAMELAGRDAAVTLEKHLSALATIASVAPLLGLLGTVIGMIEIFGAQNAASSSPNPGQVAHGISVALYNTAFGLIVAIPALIFWRYFRQRADATLHHIEQQAERFAKHLAKLG